MTKLGLGLSASLLLITIAAGVQGQQQNTASNPGELTNVIQRVKNAYVGAADAALLTSYQQDLEVYVPGAYPNERSELLKKATEILKNGVKIIIVYRAPDKSVLILGFGERRLIQGISGASTWQVRLQPADSGVPTREVSGLSAARAGMMRISEDSSIQAFIRLLYEATDQSLRLFKVRHDKPYWVVTWTQGSVTNDLYFSEENWLCEKHVRKTPEGVARIYYSDYRPEKGILLPHKIEIRNAQDSVFATQVIEHWDLGKKWPDEFFTAEGVRVPGDLK